jgi:succinoglycan biosynthesis protein ExoM
MISICIPTYKRPQQLKRLLSKLIADVERPEAIEIIICDNDAERSAESVVAAISQIADLPVRYYCEPEQNISLARNKTVAEARGEWLAFIDDDEEPTSSWLSLLYATASTSEADGVFGPVLPVLPDEAPVWVRRGNFFHPARIPTSTVLRISETAAGNALIKSEVLRQIPGPFDPRFGRSGGEDTLLFGTLLKKHRAHFIYCPEAEVVENVGLARCCRSWLVRRAFRGGLIWAKIESELNGSPTSRYLRMVFALMALLLLTPLAVICLPFQASRSTLVLQQTASRFGQICSILSIQYVEYQ